MKRLWALDFGRDSVIVAVAETKAGGELRLLGGGESPAQGFSGGDLESLGDATEAVVAAVRAAEQRSGLKCESLFYNIDDISLESSHSTVSKSLTGEGQIRSEDVRDAMETALRMVGRFEKSAVYSCATGFLIDGKDSVINPVGVFGRQLDVSMHVLLARADHRERWQKVIERSRLKEGIPVLSLLSASHGVLDPGDPRGVILWDLGRDTLSVALIREGTLREALVLKAEGLSAADVASAVLTQSKIIEKKDATIEAMMLTGDWAENKALVEKIQSQWPGTVSVKSPWGVAELCEPRQASLVGLLRVAAASHKGPRSSQLGKNLVGLRQKAVSLINEYF